ncbi:hypothetical protein ACO22_08175 [Paracoccidioides brasiliensis]|uniref:Uncharacterized protein n=1 Tax=Paracoccidioides brasiliensis TaxID=121759 RepID=A0A1D2J2K9_PARBR|nr:hypothetical protein ACO22_08175 [Paracoccidioides brasiliensis]
MTAVLIQNKKTMSANPVWICSRNKRPTVWEPVKPAFL